MLRGIALTIAWCATLACVRADDAFYPASVPLKQARTGKLPNQILPTDKMEFGVWIPDGVQVIRGITVNPFAKNPSEAPTELKHWHELGRLWGFAFVQSNFNGTSAAEYGPSLQTALDEIAKKSNHPELAHAPFLFMGTSRGGSWSKKLALHFPDRTIAVAPTNLVIGPDTDELRLIPFWASIGEKDGGQFKDALAKLPEVRKAGGQWGLAPLWGKGHEFGFTNELAVPFFDEVIRRRYPSDQLPMDKPDALKPYPNERVWLGDVSAWVEKQHTTEIAAAGKYAKPPEQAAWLAGPDLAHAWRAFVGETKAVKITEPPGLGGGQAFHTHAPDQPIAVKLIVPASAKSVSLFDGERLLERKAGPAAEFSVTLATGVHPIYAVVESEDGSLYARPHTLIVRHK